jgi:hypothetical protein
MSARRARAHIEEYRIAGCRIRFEPGPKGWRVDVRLRTGTRVRTRWHRSKADAMGEALRALHERDERSRRDRIAPQLGAVLATSLTARQRNGR